MPIVIGLLFEVLDDCLGSIFKVLLFSFKIKQNLIPSTTNQLIKQQTVKLKMAEELKIHLKYINLSYILENNQVISYN